MNVIAQSQTAEHTLIQSSDKAVKSVSILISPFIEYVATERRVVALSNDSINAGEVIGYYKDAGFDILLVVDSKMLPELTAKVMAYNYQNARVTVLDTTTGTIHPLNDFYGIVSYLSLCCSLTSCPDVITSLATQLLRTMPLINSTVDSCLATHAVNAINKLQQPVLRHALNEQLSHCRSQVKKFMCPTVQTDLVTVKSLNAPECAKLINNTRTLAIKSATGTGKTKHIFGPVAQTAKKQNKKITYLSYLTALVEQYCTDNLATSYNDELSKLEEASAIGVVVNSIWKTHIFTFLKQTDILIIDEFEKVLSAIVCSKDSEKLPKQLVFECLSEIIRNVPQLIVGDADISNIGLSYIKGLRGEVTLLNCTANPYTNIKAVITDKNQYISNLHLDKQFNQDKIFLFDSLNTLRNVTKSLGYENENKLDCEKSALADGVLVIHGDNKDMPEQSAFLANPNDEIRKYKAIMASPCLGSGFSITTHFSDKVVVFCDKTLAPLELVNFARRFRTAKTIWFAIDAFADFSAPKAHKIKYDSRFHYQATDALQIEFLNSKHMFFSSFALHMHITLEELGFTTASAPSSLMDQCFAKKCVNEQQKTYRTLLIEAIVNAPNLSSEQAVNLCESNARTSSDNAALTKRRIRTDYQLLNVEQDDVLFHYEFMKHRDIFNAFPFVKRHKVKQNIQPKHQDTANFIFQTILKEHGFCEIEKSLSIHKDDVRIIVERCYNQRTRLNWVLDETLHITKPLHKEAKLNKATSYLKKLLSSFGFEMARFSGNTNKARVTLHKHAATYAEMDTNKYIPVDIAA
ncbi:TPA: hypothetical protein I7243_23555 [Vibrio vulnificus]|nr:hypothetical protein [Vibrio vulnificus]HAS6346210.1 hypothetical protein [Vibrio vulnificus]